MNDKRILIKQVDGGYIITRQWALAGEDQATRENLGDMLDVVAEYFVASPLPNAVAVEPLSDEEEPS